MVHRLHFHLTTKWVRQYNSNWSLTGLRLRYVQHLKNKSDYTTYVYYVNIFAYIYIFIVRSTLQKPGVIQPLEGGMRVMIRSISSTRISTYLCIYIYKCKRNMNIAITQSTCIRPRNKKGQSIPPQLTNKWSSNALQNSWHLKTSWKIPSEGNRV